MLRSSRVQGWRNRLARIPLSVLLGVFGLVLAVSAVSITGLLIWQLRVRTLHTAEAELHRLNVALAEQAARTIQSVDVLLQSTAESYKERLAVGTVDDAGMQRLLAERGASLPDIVRGHWLIAADGYKRYSARAVPQPPIPAEQWPYFLEHRENPNLGVRVSEPLRNRSEGRWGAYVTRRVNGPDGAFAGVVFAFLDAAYFERLFDAMKLGRADSAGLVSAEGRLLARYPERIGAVGQLLGGPAQALLRAVAEEMGPVSRTVSLPEPRLVVAQSLTNAPLIVVSSRSLDEILIDWRRESQVLGLGAAGAAAVLLALIWALVRQLRHHEATAGALAESRRMLETAQAVAHIGSWVSELDAVRQLSWSPEMFRIFGVDPRLWTGTIDAFYQLVHPDDRDGVRRAVRRAAESDARYNIEHRIVHPDGTVRWVHEQAEILRDPGKPVRLLGTTHDITERHQAEEALRLSEARFRDYAEISSDWYWETGRDHRFTYFSRRLRTFGADDEQLVGRLRLEIAADVVEQPEKWEAHMATLDRHEAFREFVYRARSTPEGRSRYVAISGKPVFDAAGNFAGYRGTARDVTAMMEAEERLRQSEARQRDFAATASDWYWETDDQYRFTYVTGMGGDVDESDTRRLGKTRIELAADAEEQPAKWREHHAQIERREAFRDFVYRMKSIDGREELFMSVSGKPIYDAAGRFTGYRGTARDVTTVLRAEEALRLSEARQRDFAETASDWYWESGPDHRFTYMSTRIRAFGMDERAWIGRKRFENADDIREHDAKWREHIAQLERHESFRDFVYKTRLTEGRRETWISVSGKPIFDAEGRFLGYRGTGREVTAAIQAEANLREAKLAAETASAAKTAFLANMSHELRTPLNAIIGFAEALSAGYFGTLNDRQTEYLRDIQTSGNHLLLLISDLLDVSKIEAGKLELHREPLDIATEIEAALRLVRPKANESGIALQSSVPGDLRPYQADRRAVKQVLLNLLSNAVKFTPPGGSVTVEVNADPEGDLRISVADTGIGIAPQDLPKIVMPFGTLARNATLSRAREGTGLGLPLSKSLIEMHGGRLEIVSEPGRGTIATVRFPGDEQAA